MPEVRQEDGNEKKKKNHLAHNKDNTVRGRPFAAIAPLVGP